MSEKPLLKTPNIDMTEIFRNLPKVIDELDKFSDLPSIKLFDGEWATNAQKGGQARRYIAEFNQNNKGRFFFQGRPKASAVMTVEQLEEANMVGIYYVVFNFNEKVDG